MTNDPCENSEINIDETPEEVTISLEQNPDEVEISILPDETPEEATILLEETPEEVTILLEQSPDEVEIAISSIGEKGDKGVKGDTGIQGDTGIIGITGSTGIQGITGATGITGDTGTKGIAGDTGIQGENGLSSISTDTDTNITGILKGNGSKIEIASGGTDYQAPLSFPLSPSLGGLGTDNGTNVLTVPATGTAALLGTANVFTAGQDISWGGETLKLGADIDLSTRTTNTQ